VIRARRSGLAATQVRNDFRHCVAIFSRSSAMLRFIAARSSFESGGSPFCRRGTWGFEKLGVVVEEAEEGEGAAVRPRESSPRVV
jgi:hypothetical protein